MTISTERIARPAARPGAWCRGRALSPDAGVTVVIPTKNEEGLIAEIIEAVRPHAAEILVVDGHSTDRTAGIAAAMGARVVLDAGRGKGEALRRSFVEARHDILVFIDADGSHDPNDIPRLVEPISAATRSWSSPRGRAAAATSSRHRRATAALHRIAAHHAGDQLSMAGPVDRQPERVPGDPPRRGARARSEGPTSRPSSRKC